MPESALDRNITIFDRCKQDVLSFTMNLGGKTEKVYLLDELLYDDHDLIDYQKLASRLRKLPAVLTFFIVLKKSSENVRDDMKERFDAWYAEAAREANEKELERILALPGPASMKKPPTLDQIKGLVQVNQAEVWRGMREDIRGAQERVDLLSAMYEGLKASIDMARSEEKLLNTLLSQGMEQVGSNSASRFQPQRISRA